MERLRVHWSSVWAGILLAGFVALVYGPRAVWGFWVDETGSYWMACSGPWEAVARTWAWPGQSILYSLLQSCFCSGAGEGREIWLRIPALAGTWLAAMAVFQVLRRSVATPFAIAGALLLLLHPLMQEVGAIARPYSLAVWAAVLSSDRFLRWMTERRETVPAGYVFWTLLMLLLHYLFAAVVTVQGLFVLWRWRQLGPGRRAILRAWLYVALGLTPVLLHVLSLATQSDYQEVARVTAASAPPVDDLLLILFPRALLRITLLCAVALLVSRVWPPREKAFEFCYWSVLGAGIISACFVLAQFGFPIWQVRYLSSAAPAIPILLMLASARLHLNWSAALLWFAAVGAVSTYRQSEMRGYYRDTFRTVREADGSGAVPVLMQTPLWESGKLDWRETDPARNRLYGPVVAYQVKNPVSILPFRVDGAVKEHLTRHRERLGARFLFIGSNEQEAAPLAAAITELGYDVRPLHDGTYPVFEARLRRAKGD